MGRYRTVRVATVWVLLVCGAGLGAAGVAEAVTADANEAPLADAGLDQTVDVDATVHLDATGSLDPDGEIVGYEWQIESPNGVEFTPDCGTCARATFLATTTGIYNATVTVTDDEGTSRSDTLRVTVEPVERPTVRLVGLSEVPVNATGWFTARASAEDAPLARLEWVLNGTQRRADPLRGRHDNATLTRAFSTAGDVTVRARVIDRTGRTGTATLNLTVVPGDANASSGRVWNGTGACVRATDSRDPSGCQDEVAFDHSDGTVVLDDGDNDGRYTFRGRVLKVVDVEGRMTDVIRVDGDAFEEKFRDLPFDTSADGTPDDEPDDPSNGATGIDHER